MKALTKILVVDDDEDILLLVQYCFSAEKNIILECVKSGEEALQKALEIEPDLILLDVLMVPMDGIATLNALRLVPKLSNTPIVFLTAKVQKKEIEEYFHLGISDVITKPFDPLTFPARVIEIWTKLQTS